MLDRAKLVNILVFLDRTPCNGPEAFAWVETRRAVEAEIARLDEMNEHAASGA